MEEDCKLPAGPELDALIADKVMGWKCQTFHNQYRADAPPQPCNHWPYYSTDIAAAWEIVEKMQTDHSLYLNLSGRRQEGIWFASFIDKDYIRFNQVNHADTAPHVICLAALAAINVIPCDKK